MTEEQVVKNPRVASCLFAVEAMKVVTDVEVGLMGQKPNVNAVVKTKIRLCLEEQMRTSGHNIH